MPEKNPRPEIVDKPLGETHIDASQVEGAEDFAAEARVAERSPLTYLTDAFTPK